MKGGGKSLESGSQKISATTTKEKLSPKDPSIWKKKYQKAIHGSITKGRKGRGGRRIHQDPVPAEKRKFKNE